MKNANDTKVIGKVAALEKQPSTIDDFYFWTNSDVILNPFDVVVVDHVEGSRTYGVIEEISHITDSASFLGDYISNDFGNLNTKILTERVGMNYVKARVVGNTKNIYIPVHNGSLVHLGTREDITEALGLEQNAKSLVCGFVEMYGADEDNKIELPVYVNSDFLIGPEGAHLNISGISGLAAKTSYTMFLLNALQQKSLSDERVSQSVAYIFLNVKGRDLLTIDEPAEDLTTTDVEKYKNLGLELKPFRNATYFYPFSSNGGYASYVRPEVYREQLRKGKAYTYKYLFNQDKENLDLLFSNIDDPQQTIESILNYIISEQGGFSQSDDWDSMLRKVDEKCKAGVKGGDKEISVMSWRKFKRIIRKAIEKNSMFSGEVSEGEPETRLEDRIKLIKRDDVYVIDIAKQDENMQAFIFGSVMQAVQKLKLGEFDNELSDDEREQIPDRIVIFVDELNKYASNDVPKSSPILRLLLDIAERGRSLGIVLFSAEQFKSSIHKRITGNCSTHAYGRTNSIELADKAYSFVPNTFKNIMTRLKQGEYIIQNPMFSSLLKIQFPRPLYKQDKGNS